MLQVTLVDCPGHASLIRTIIGGAQIIDMVLLVINATKGIQTQTAECIVIAEMTAPNLVVALNKVDLFKSDEKTQEIHKVSAKVATTLKHTRFKNAKMVPISAAVGGEKVAAVSKASTNTSNCTAATLPTENISSLLDLITTEIRPPKNRNLQSLIDQKPNFHFAVDHCFPIKGQGTVITGTALSGFAQVNDVIEFPQYAIQRKIKSMQMFRTPIRQIKQGDRAGICLANLDSKLLERGVVSHPGSVKLIEAAIALVKKVRYFKGRLVSGGKFHVSVGHSTVMATATFWGAKELKKQLSLKGSESNEEKNSKKEDSNTLSSSSLGGSAEIAGLPKLKFDFDQDFVYQEEVLESLNHDDDFHGNNMKKSSANDSPLHWALLTFQTPVYCPLNSLIIGSRLDTDIQASSCRLAFSGRLIEKCDPKKETSIINLYTHKEKSGQVCRLGEPYTRSTDSKIIRYDVYGHDLFKKETNMSQFVGMKIQTSHDGEVGVIQSSFGTSGKFKAHFPAGTLVKDGEKLYLRFKRYFNDKAKAMHQDNELLVPPPIKGEKIIMKGKNKKMNKEKQSENTNVQNQSAVTKEVNSNPDESIETNSFVTGVIDKLKSDAVVDGKFNVAIISGLFTPEMNVREKLGVKVVISDTKQEGSIIGSFGKAGKCKVAFPDGLSEDAVGSKVQMKA